jgi:hypothetical protein
MSADLPTPAPEDNEVGEKPPFPPVWLGDTHPGHRRSCAVRVKGACSCGFAQLPLSEQLLGRQPTGREAVLPLAGEFIHSLLSLPDDVHVVGATWENVYDQDRGNVLLTLRAFSDSEFPGKRVTAQFHEKWNVTTGRYETIFDGWEDAPEF